MVMPSKRQKEEDALFRRYFRGEDMTATERRRMARANKRYGKQLLKELLVMMSIALPTIAILEWLYWSAHPHY